MQISGGMERRPSTTVSARKLDGVVCVILGLAILVEHLLVTDRRINGRTDRQTDT